MQALLGGSADYTSACGSTIAAAVRGRPVKLVFISSSKPQFELTSQPQINSDRELTGKVVAISSRRGSNDLLLQLIPQRNGLAPHKAHHQSASILDEKPSRDNKTHANIWASKTSL